ncbi:hypothetical protein [Nocardia brasiliensis]|uniref:hypothetical protein n=1 Tax=Nocardia brasiliensis TaxID=37326 RepID=UPI002453B44B|nr:hypothetical protein [Nocardia brasiliensis]
MTDIADAVVEELGSAVAETMRTVRPRIPASPAATLGRLRLSSDEFGAYAFGENGIRGELSRLGQLLPERILGALELLVAELVVPVVPSLAALLPMPDDGRAVMVGHMMGAGATTTAINELEAFRPGALALVVALTARLSEHCDVVAQLRSAPVGGAGGGAGAGPRAAGAGGGPEGEGGGGGGGGVGE